MSEDAFIGLGPNGLRIGFDADHYPRREYCPPVFAEVYDPRFAFQYRQLNGRPHREITYIEVVPPPYPTAYTYGICPPAPARYYTAPTAPANSETYYYNQRLYPPTQPEAQNYAAPDYESAPAQQSSDASSQTTSAYARTAADYYARQRAVVPQSEDSEIDLPLPDSPAPQATVRDQSAQPGTDQSATAQQRTDATNNTNAVSPGDDVDLPLPDATPVKKAAASDIPPATTPDAKSDTPPAGTPETNSDKPKVDPKGDTASTRTDSDTDEISATKADTVIATKSDATKSELAALPDISTEATKIRDKINQALSQNDNGNFDSEAEILKDLQEFKKHGDLGTIYLDQLRRKLYEDGPWHINCVSPGTASITLNSDGSLEASNGGFLGMHERTLKIDPNTGKIDRNGYHWFGRNSDDAKSTTVSTAK